MFEKKYNLIIEPINIDDIIKYFTARTILNDTI